jgi:hypothetical protein
MEGATGAEDCRTGLQSIPGQQKLMNLNGTLPGSGGVNPGRLAAATPPPFVCCPLSCWSPNSPFTANSEPSASSFLENTSWPGLATAAPVHSTCSRAGAWVLFYSSRCHAAPRFLSTCDPVLAFPWTIFNRVSFLDGSVCSDPGCDPRPITNRRHRLVDDD